MEETKSQSPQEHSAWRGRGSARRKWGEAAFENMRKARVSRAFPPKAPPRGAAVQGPGGP